MTLLIAGLVIFLGVHCVSIVAPAARDRWAMRLGANAWRGLYSLIAAVGLLLLIYGYGLARRQPVVLYVPPTGLRHLALVLMLPVFPLLIATYVPGSIRAALKQPMLIAVKTWALAHLLANGMLADVLLFGSFLAWAVADRISLKRRAQRPAKTAPPSRWNDAIAVVAGLGLYVATLLYLHGKLIGVPLL